MILRLGAITNRFDEPGSGIYNCCSFTPPSFYIQVTGVASNQTRLEICDLPVYATRNKGDTKASIRRV